MDIRAIAKQWAEDARFDEGTRRAARLAADDEKELMSAFGSELRFGTGGMRGIVGTGTARMNRYTVGRATLGLARYLKSKRSDASVAISRDPRHGSDEFAAVCAAVCAAEGVRAYIFADIAPTPMLSYAVRALKCDAGVMITASHNPAEYNGYKVYGADGCQITDHAADEITAFIDAAGYTDFRLMPEREARAAGLIKDIGDDVRRGFAQACLFCRPDPAVFTGIRVMYTPLNGTGLLPVREVLNHMQGVSLSEVEEQTAPDGDFPTCKKPNPELDETLVLGIERARAAEADLLLATDPDCDRVGVVARASDGSYKRLSGNEVGLLLLEYILQTRRSQGTMPRGAVVVKTIVTSDLAFSVAKAYGVKVREVLTGFKYIGELIGELEGSRAENRFVFGFEESCGYLAGTHVRDKDGVMACMLVCEMAQALKGRGLTLPDALERLYAKYGYMSNALMSFDISGALPMSEMKATMTRLRETPPEALAGSAIDGIKDYLSGIDGLPASDVLTFSCSNGLKAIVRPSGTEPKVKVYLSAKADTKQAADALIDAMKKDVQGWM